MCICFSKDIKATISWPSEELRVGGSIYRNPSEIQIMLWTTIIEKRYLT